MDWQTILLGLGLLLNLVVTLFNLFENRIKLERRLTKMEIMLEVLLNQLGIQNVNVLKKENRHG